MFKVPIKDTVSLLPTLNNVPTYHMFKILKNSIYTKVEYKLKALKMKK